MGNHNAWVSQSALLVSIDVINPTLLFKETVSYAGFADLSLNTWLAKNWAKVGSTNA